MDDLVDHGSLAFKMFSFLDLLTGCPYTVGAVILAS